MSDFEPIDLFGIPLPADTGEKLMKGLILSSKVGRTMYEEHVNNGFTEAQAMELIINFQGDVISGFSDIVSAFVVNTNKGE